jgi:hypothetical protein
VYRLGLLTLVEDVVYVALGIFPAGGTVVLLMSLGFSVWRNAPGGTLAGSVLNPLDQAFLILMILEPLYTVQVSFREHVLVLEPSCSSLSSRAFAAFSSSPPSCRD